MSDTSSTNQPAPPPAPPAPPAAAEASPGIDYKALAAELAPLLTPPGAVAQAAATAPAAPAAPPAPVNLFEKGQVVSYTYTTPYDGEVTRHGIVIETLPDEGAGARSAVAWFDHVSGPIGDNELEAC